MHTRIGFALALALLVAGGPATAKKKKSEEGGAGDLAALVVTCSTPGASIFVNGEMIGVTPIDLPLPVTPGDHSLKVTKLGFAPYIDVFSAKGKRPVKLEMELVPVSGVLHVKSNVAGSRVMIDGRYVGEAPLDVEVDVGARAVQLSKGGYHDFFKNVLAVAGQEASLEVSLEELPAEINPYKIKPQAPPKWYQKKWVWATVAVGALVVAGGVTTAAVLSTHQYDVCAGADYCF